MAVDGPRNDVMARAIALQDHFAPPLRGCPHLGRAFGIAFGLEEILRQPGKQDQQPGPRRERETDAYTPRYRGCGPGFPGHQLRVQTSEGYIEVTGTAVSVYKSKDFTCVCVLEGKARIGKDEARMENVAGGLSKVMFSGDRPSVVHAIEPQHKEELLEFLDRNKGVFD